MIEVGADAGGGVGVGSDDDADVAFVHGAEDWAGGVHFREFFLQSRGVEFHGGAGGSDAVEGLEDVGPDSFEVPIGDNEIFHEVGVGEAVVESGLGGIGEVAEVGAGEFAPIVAPEGGLVFGELWVD